MKNLFLLCLLIDAHLGLVLAKFEVIAAIFEREIKKKAKKAHFDPTYAPCKRLPIEFKLAHGLVWLIFGYFTICTAHIGLKQHFQGLSPT